ncbi:hypothetical protein Fluta_1667 [Fluviicola taffensis DSM 16823]|uniref:NlpC/P60 domain-containing protein n=2 Tax=Fluviicola TaxID=332102 RepID=F2IGP2_FLUTR|nr:hypothetical protein Fluta_1667 [Fluviicola taffensis DSM 16823]
MGIKLKIMQIKLIQLCALCLFLHSCLQNKTQVKGNLLAYEDLKVSVENQRLIFQKEYSEADEVDRNSIEEKAASYLLEKITTDFFNQWEGTEWDFNGTTRTPRKGKIACGYFITTLLSDVGFKIPRTKWAQQASEYYITRMTADVKRFSNQTPEYMKDYFLKQPDGLYIAGLDSHVGFVYKSGNEVTFTHASYYDPKIGVQTEELIGDNPFAKSAYRVVGRILDKEMVRKWILGESWSE